LKIFFIRLLQVVWCLTGVAIPMIPLSILYDPDDSLSYLSIEVLNETVVVIVLGIIVWCSLLIVIQYLIFGNLRPVDLFNGVLND